MTLIHDLDCTALTTAFRARTLSAVEVTDDALNRAEAAQSTINPFVHIDHAGAIAAAQASEARWRAGTPLSAIDGVPVTIKDNIAWAGLPCRKGSLLPAAPDVADAPAVSRLREAGAVLLGKTTMPEFGWKGLSDSPLTGLTRNPWNRARTTGGSSAGAAACAALGIGRIHIGTDGAGSVRIPAAFCGVVGLKPTYGRVPAWPISVMGGLAHLGPLTPTVRESALALSVIGAPDHRDLTAWLTPPDDYTRGLDMGIAGLRIAVSPRLGYVARIDARVVEATLSAARALAGLGAIVDEADPGFTDPIAVLDDLWFAGAALILRAASAVDREKMDPGLVAAAEVGARLDAATLVDRQNYARTALWATVHAFHQRFDLLLTPQMPTGAIPFGADVPRAGFAGVADWGDAWTNWSPFTYPFNITQQPAISVPCGFDADGMPIAIQFVAARGRDDLVLRAAAAFERARPVPRPPQANA